MSSKLVLVKKLNKEIRTNGIIAVRQFFLYIWTKIHGNLEDKEEEVWSSKEEVNNLNYQHYTALGNSTPSSAYP